MSVTLDTESFWKRLRLLYGFWRAFGSNFKETEAIMIVNGSRNEETYTRGVAIQRWLIGYELTDTVIVLTLDHGITVLAGSKKIALLKSAQEMRSDEDPELHFITKMKGDNTTQFNELLTVLGKCGNKSAGYFEKDVLEGSFQEAWFKAVRDAGIKLEGVTVSTGAVMAQKDKRETKKIRDASIVSGQLMDKYFTETMIKAINNNRKIKHSTLAEKIEQVVEDPERLGLEKRIDADNLDVCYTPIIQSGGKFDLKPSAQSSEEELHFGTVLCSIGVRYEGYCSNVARTFLISPSADQEENYLLLADVQKAAMRALVPGKPLNEVYKAAVDLIKERKPELVGNFTKNIGFLTGLLFRESSFVVGPKCTRPAKETMVLNLSVGFENLERSDATSDKDRRYALFIADTVVVGKGGAEAVTSAKKNLKSITFDLDDSVDADLNGDELEKTLGEKRRRVPVASSDADAEAKRKQHQASLAKKLNEEARKRLLNVAPETKEAASLTSVRSYKRTGQLPMERTVRRRRLHVDQDRDTVVVPINGMAVPFHIGTIKMVTVSDQEDYLFMRLQFHTPTGAALKDDKMFPEPKATYLKEINYRSSQRQNIKEVFRIIKELQKRFKTKESERKEMNGLVAQDKLKLVKGAMRLNNIKVRPSLARGKVTGTLEAHKNGFRFSSSKTENVDIIYSNIKHAFYQPSTGDVIVLFHFELHSPIILNKKKHSHIQFYCETQEAVHDLNQRRRNLRDADELELEQKERQERNRLNKLFKKFAEHAQNLVEKELGEDTKFEFDIPYNDLKFTGSDPVSKGNVNLLPSTNALVSLSEWPAFVLSLDDIELAHFERVRANMKSFDVVFVHKDYTRAVSTISAIPGNYLDQVQKWLDSCDLRYTDGTASLNWKEIMKHITTDPDGFFQDGGWGFLNMDASDDEGGDGGEDSDSEGSEDSYEPSEDDPSSEEYKSDSGVSDSSSDEESEEGTDWSDMEDDAREQERTTTTTGGGEVDKDKRKGKKRGHDSPAAAKSKKARR